MFISAMLLLQVGGEGGGGAGGGGEGGGGAGGLQYNILPLLPRSVPK